MPSNPSRQRTHNSPTPEPPARSTAVLVLARICLGLAATVAGLLVADLALSLVQPPRMSGKRLLIPVGQPFGFHCYPTNPNGEFEPAPKPEAHWKLRDVSIPPQELPLDRLKETPWCVRYDLNSQGLRGAVVTPKPVTATVRILGVGDSFAIGEGVSVNDTLFAQLDRVLGDRVQVLNAGRSGYDTALELALMRKMVPKTHAHRTIVVFLLNDIKMPRALRKRERWINDLVNVREQQLWAGKDQPWWLRSRMLKWVAAWWQMRSITSATVQWYLDAWDPAINPLGVGRFRDDLHAMAQVSANGLVLVLYPMLLQLDNYPFARIHQQVATMAHEASIPVLDLAPAFASQTASTLHVHDVDHHPNARAHAHAAKVVATWLRSIPGFLNPSPSEERP